MRSLRYVALVCLLLTSAAFADSVWFFGNTGGTLTYDPNTQTLSLTSTITEIISAGNNVEKGTLGTLTVITGPLTSGSILHHAFFGTSTITIDGFSGTLYSLNWYQVPNSDEFHLAGAGAFGFTQIANFDQLVVLSGTNQFTVLEGKVGLAPEPSTMSLLGTGLALFSGAGVARFKKRRRANEKGGGNSCSHVDQ